MKLVVSGPNAVEQAAAQCSVHKAWCVSGKKLPKAIAHLNYKQVKPSDLDGILRHKNHQGVAVEVSVPQRPVEDVLEQAEAGEGLVLICEHIEDPHNLGAMLRSACAFGAEGLIVSQRRSAQLTDAVVRASAGVALGYPPVTVPGSIPALLMDLDQRGWNTVGFSLEGDDLGNVIHNMPPGATALVIGNEKRGLSDLAHKRCTHLARIPIQDVESLNASVACGIGLFALSKARFQ